MSSPISICYIELILEPVKKRICGSATFRFPPSEPLLLKENPVVSGILFCDVSIFFFCLEQLMMFQSGFVDLGGMMFPDDILLKSVYDWCNVLRPWIKSAGLKGSKRGGKVPVPAKLGRSMGCYSLEPRAGKAVWARCGGSVPGGGERAARQHAPGRAWARAQQRAPASTADMLMNLLYPVIILIPYMGDKGN